MRKVSPVTGQPDYPGAGWLITSGFATDAYFQRFGDWHTGHDLARSREGNEPIYAIADGKVIWAENAGNGGFGNLVVVQHNDKLFSRYAHLSRIDVGAKQDVAAGQCVGLLGTTGRSTAPHLHFDIMRIKNALDWPGKNKQRVLETYIDPNSWYREADVTVSVEPTLTQWVRVNAPATLNVRARDSSTAAIMYRLPNNSIIEIKGIRIERDGIVWRELVSGGFVAEMYTEPVPAPTDFGVGVRTFIAPGGTPSPTPVATPAAEASTAAVSVAAQAAPSPVAAPTFTIEGRGVHASAGGWAPSGEELSYVRANGVKSVLIVAYEPGQALLTVTGFRDAGVTDFIIRAATHAPVHANPDDFAADTLNRLREYYAALGGNRMLIAVHNEPNIDREGLGRAWQNGAEFGNWYTRVAQIYREQLPGALIGFPALSPGGDADIPGVVKRIDEWRFASECAPAIRASDWLGVHAYFVGDGTDIDLKPGKWRELAGGRPVIITEGGPADNIANSGAKLNNIYRRCSDVGFPVMAWLLSGAGAWHSADWTKNGVRV